MVNCHEAFAYHYSKLHVKLSCSVLSIA